MHYLYKSNTINPNILKIP